MRLNSSASFFMLCFTDSRSRKFTIIFKKFKTETQTTSDTGKGPIWTYFCFACVNSKHRLLGQFFCSQLKLSYLGSFLFSNDRQSHLSTRLIQIHDSRLVFESKSITPYHELFSKEFVSGSVRSFHRKLNTMASCLHKNILTFTKPGYSKRHWGGDGGYKTEYFNTSKHLKGEQLSVRLP